MIECACGCGTLILPRDKKNRPRTFMNGHNSYLRIGEKNPLWKGGLKLNHLGYWMRRVYNHPYGSGGYVLEHRLIVEAKIGRYLHPDEKVHHKDGNIQNNTIENLEVISQSKHMSHHRQNGDCVGGHGYGKYGKAGLQTFSVE